MNKNLPFFLLLLVAVQLINGCAKPEPASIGEVCQKPKNSLVLLEGYLVLPNYMTQRTIYGKRENKKTYQLFVVEQPDAKGASVRAIVEGTSAKEPNTIRDLPPNGYTFKDLQIFTDRGNAVGAGTRLKITGKVIPNADGKCDVEVSKIETP